MILTIKIFLKFGILMSVWQDKRLWRCLVGRHAPTSFYSDFYKCRYYQCEICAWPLFDLMGNEK